MTTTPVMSITDEQIAEIEELAQQSTQGRIYDRLPTAGGGIKYHCFGDDGSIVLQVDHKNGEFGFVGPRGEEDERFFLACTPSAILALISRLRAAEKDAERLEFMMANQAIIWSMNGLDMPTVYSVSWNGMGKDRHDKWFDTERAAIDTAMEQSK